MPKAKYSPCIKVCQQGANGYCLGCYRTPEEVRGWRHLSEDEQLDGIEMLRERGIKFKLIEQVGVGESNA